MYEYKVYFPIYYFGSISIFTESDSLFQTKWVTDAQPTEEKKRCDFIKGASGKTRKKVKCFALKEGDDNSVSFEYKGKTFDKEDFCIVINPQATKPSDHFAEVCEDVESSLLQ